MAKKKTAQVKPLVKKPEPDERTLLLQELINIAIEISLCEPDDKEELAELIPRLRKLIRKIRSVFKSDSS